MCVCVCAYVHTCVVRLTLISLAMKSSICSLSRESTLRFESSEVRYRGSKLENKSPQDTPRGTIPTSMPERKDD